MEVLDFTLIQLLALVGATVGLILGGGPDEELTASRMLGPIVGAGFVYFIALVFFVLRAAA